MNEEDDIIETLRIFDNLTDEEVLDLACDMADKKIYALMAKCSLELKKRRECS